MREWWKLHDLTHFPEERIIHTDSTLEESMQMIINDLDLVKPL